MDKFSNRKSKFSFLDGALIWHPNTGGQGAFLAFAPKEAGCNWNSPRDDSVHFILHTLKLKK
jgi:hypothetical protein